MLHDGRMTAYRVRRAAGKAATETPSASNEVVAYGRLIVSPNRHAIQ